MEERAMKQFTYTEARNNLDRFINENELIFKHQCPGWITKYLSEGEMMCDLFGEDKVCEMIKNIRLRYENIFEVIYMESDGDVPSGWILLESKIAKSKERYVGVGKNRRFYPSVYVDAYAIKNSYSSAELSRLLRALFFSIDKRFTEGVFAEIKKGKECLADIKVNDLIKSHGIGEMTLRDAYNKMRWEENIVEKKGNKIKLYCSSPYLVFIETDKGIIHLPLEGLIKGDKKDCDDTMLKYLYQDAYKEHKDKLGWMEELKGTPEYKVIEDVFFNKD